MATEMANRRNTPVILRVFAVFAAGFLVSSASASTISYNGAFTHDDDEQIFYYNVANQGSVTVQTTSFAVGGFIPILSLFDTNGNFLFLDSGYAGNVDALLSWVSDANTNYLIMLTEYDNFPNALRLSDGFTEDGQGDFTTVLSGFPGPFRDPFGDQLTGDWAVTFTSAEPSLIAGLPEPSALWLSGPGMLLLFWLRRKRAARS